MLQRRRYVLFCVFLTFLLIPLASAGFFSDVWDWLTKRDAPVTGRVADVDAGESAFAPEDSGDKISEGTIDDEIASLLQLPLEKGKSCCFCGYDANHTDAPLFRKACEKFFAGKAHPVNKDIQCEVKEMVPLAQKETLIPQLLQKHTCKEPLYLYHAEHGPACEQLVKFIEVCTTNAPTCDIDIASISCQSFRDEEEVRGYFKELQQKISPDITITACGNRLNGFFDDPTCSLVDIYTVTQESLTVKRGPCQKEGSICGPFNEDVAHACTNAEGELMTQRCCRNATTLQSYTRTDSIFMEEKGKTQGVYAAEGAECSIAPCAQKGEQCSVVGETYSCILPDGSATRQTCCAHTTAGFQGVFLEPRASCSLPSCVRKEGMSCEGGGARMACLDSKGKEASQICCERVNQQGHKIPIGFLSEIGKECNCDSAKQAKIDSVICLENGKRRRMSSNLLYPALYNLHSCEYEAAPEGTRCEYGMLCDAEGKCTKKAPCTRNADCYNKGKKFCAKNAEVTLGRGVVIWQHCKSGFCETSDHWCETDEECKKTREGASCIKRHPLLEGVS